VYWSNATATGRRPAGCPCSEALIVYYGSTGVYYLSDYTDANGHPADDAHAAVEHQGHLHDDLDPDDHHRGKNASRCRGSSTWTWTTWRGRLNIPARRHLHPEDPHHVPVPWRRVRPRGLDAPGFTTEVGSGVKMVRSYFTDQEGNDLLPSRSRWTTMATSRTRSIDARGCDHRHARRGVGRRSQLQPHDGDGRQSTGRPRRSK